MKRALLVCLLAGCGGPADGPVRVREIVRSHDAPLFEVVELVSARVEDHFAERLARVDGVSDEFFSARWKWRAAFWSREDYERAARRLLDRRLFDGWPALAAAIRLDVAAAIEASDNRLLVDVGRRAAPALPDLDLGRFHQGLRLELEERVIRDAEINLLAFATGDFAGAMAGALLARSGLLGPAVAAGAASSWWTAGAGLVAAVVVTIAIEAAVGGALEAALRGELHCRVDSFRMDALRRVRDSVTAALTLYRDCREEAVARAAGAGDETDPL